MVAVLLAVYNGEKYLKEQLNSLLAQTVSDVKIIIRNDGSHDASAEIIDSYCQMHPEKIFSLKGEPTGSAAKNFACLLKECDDADYIMFCDQDDVWLPDKIEKTLAAMQDAESNNKSIPVLVHTDLKVVDSALNVINESFFDFQRLSQDNVTLQRFLVQNYVTGCTVMINRALRQKCGNIPDGCIMHDWWLALVAVLFGKLICVNEATMLYRQHSDNQVGAKASYGIALIKRKLQTLDQVKKNYKSTYVQASLLLSSYGESLNKNQKELIEKYCQIPNMCKLKKIKTVKKYGFKKGTRLRVIGQYILM